MKTDVRSSPARVARRGGTRRAACAAVIAALAATQLAGCATNQQPSGTAIGAGVGAVTGGVIGALAGNRRGAIVGALAGAAVGAIAGHFYDKQVATRAEAEKKYGPQVAGDRIEIESATLTPENMSGGATVDSAVQYTALSSNRDAPIKVVETRTLTGQGDSIELAKREVARTQGTHTSTMRFQMPQDVAKGLYTLETTISDGKQTKTARSVLRVI